MSDVPPSDVERELLAAREGALLWPRPDLATLAVTGPDRQSWLNGLVTCDLSKVREGGGAYGLSVSKAGKVQAEIVFLVGAERILAGVRRDLAPALATTFEGYLIMEDAEIRVDEGLGWLWAFGPAAREAVAGVAAARSARWAALRRGGLDLTAVALPTAEIEAFEADLSAAVGSGRAHTLTPAGWARLRVEQGIAEMGIDYDDGNYPQEAALERDAVSFEKGCYLGQETVFMLEKRGHVKNRIVQLEVDGGGDLERGAPIEDASGNAVGSVTSAASRGDTWVALGWVKYKHARAGQALSVGGRTARVTERLAIAAAP